MALSSKLYRITEGNNFQNSLKNFTNQKAQIDDIQKAFNKLDRIGERSGRWLFQEKHLVRLGRTPSGNWKCKAYVAISAERLSSMKGARLYLAIKHEEHEVIPIQLCRKNRIAKGSQKDLPEAQEKKMFDDIE